MEGVVRGIHLMIGAVGEGYPDADDGEADQVALFHGRPESLVAGGDEFPRDAAALDLVDEFVSPSA